MEKDLNDAPILETVITHVGDGEFWVKLSNGEVKIAGDNICGMIRYVFFEDYTLPEVGWEVTQRELVENYHHKIHQDIQNGNVKPSELQTK